MRCVEYAIVSDRTHGTVLCFAGISHHELQMTKLQEWGRLVREDRAAVFGDIDLYL